MSAGTVEATHRRARVRLRRPLLAAVAVLPAILMFALAADRYFFQDDFLNFGLARTQGLTWHYLKWPIFGHFAPAHRFVDLLVERMFPIDFRWALLFLIVFFAGSVILLQLILEELAGRVWWTWLITAWFAISISWFPSLQWWAAGLHTEPATFLTLLCLYAYFRHRRERSPGWLALSVTSFAVGLLFYEKPLLVGVYVGLAPFLLTDVPLNTRSILRTARAELMTWAAFAVPAAIYLFVYFTQHYYFSTGHATRTALAQYLRIVWLRGFGWLTQGLAFPSLAVRPWQTVAVVLAQVAIAIALVHVVWRRRHNARVWTLAAVGALVYLLLAGVIKGHGVAFHTTSAAELNGQLTLFGLALWSIARNPRRWRVWLFFAIGFLVNVIVIGVPRVAGFGPGIGYDDRYLVEVSFLLAITVTAAFATRTGSESAKPFRMRPVVAAPAVLLIVAYCIGSLATIEVFRHNWFSPGARTYVKNLQASIKRAGPPTAYSVVDAPVPGWIVPSAFVPFNLVSNVGALVDSRLRFNAVSGRHFLVDAQGHFVPARFQTLAGGPVVSSKAGAVVAQGRAAGRGLCARTNVSFAPRRRPLDNLFLKLDYSGPERELVTAVAETGAPIGTANLDPAPGGGSALLPLGGNAFSTVTVVPPQAATTCIARIQLGRFRRA